MKLRYLMLAAAPLVVFMAPHSVPDSPKAKKNPTYAGEVGRLLNTKCVECHRPGQVAPFSLIGYDNARKWADQIAEVTGRRIMPPWKAVHGYGDFQGERLLSQDEIDTLKNWSEAGAPRGDAKSEPKPPKFESEWALGKPDMIVTADKEYHLSAEGDDVYRNFILKPKFDKATWVDGVDVRPGNPKIVHHVILYLDNKGAARKLEQATKDGQLGYTSFGGPGFVPTGGLGGWAPGLAPQRSRPGTGILVQPGSEIVMQVHYHKSGKPETDQTKVAIYFPKVQPKEEIKSLWLFNFSIKIPAGEAHSDQSITHTLKNDMTVFTVMPHMHLLGRSMKAEATLPNGKVVPLIRVDDWDFNWQLSYRYKQPLFLPKGTVIKVDAVYDNSIHNPRNPSNPPKTVWWGEQTTDEMFILIMSGLSKASARDMFLDG
ncbi:MAG: ascorbate-dependent monooxygenase [Armatimonadetes bacterium]|nr:ascorbate-dependent monooxygenase [Armatimonadota bacterium]